LRIKGYLILGKRLITIRNIELKTATLSNEGENTTAKLNNAMKRIKYSKTPAKYQLSITSVVLRKTCKISVNNAMKNSKYIIWMNFGGLNILLALI